MAMLRPSRDVLIFSVLLGIMITYFSSWLPDITNVAGIENSRISSVVSFGTLNGMIFGPILGPGISFIGILLHGIAHPDFFENDTFHIISPLFIVFSSLVGALLLSDRKKSAIILYAIPLVAWYAFPTGRTVFYYPWYHIVILTIFYIFNSKYYQKVESSKVFLFMYLFQVASIATLADHIAGSVAALALYDLPPSIFNSVVLIYPVERSILALAPTFVVFFLSLLVQNILEGIDVFEDKAREMKERSIEEYMQTEVKNILGERDKK